MNQKASNVTKSFCRRKDTLIEKVQTLVMGNRNIFVYIMNYKMIGYMIIN